MFLLIVEGLIIGCLLGLTGAGGGILAVPALMASQNWTVAQAAPVGLLAITLSAFMGTVEGLLKKIIRYRAALWIALLSIPAARYGVHLAQIVASQWLTLIFAVVMLMISYRILSNKVGDFKNPPCKISPATGRFVWNIKTASILGGLGIMIGFLTGFLGVGGGFLIVPALRKTTNLSMHSIVATSLMIIFLVGSLSIAIHFFEGYKYTFGITAGFVLACVCGMLIGRHLIRIIPAQIVQKIFASVLVCVAVYFILSTFAAIHW